MTASVRIQIYRLLVVYSLLAALVVWQKHFIWSGIESNPYLNMIIIMVFLFGSFHGAQSIAALGNESKALAALREAYDDAVRDSELAVQDPLWRQKRCFEPAVLFKRPRLLDSVYDLALDEIRRARTMRISVETMQTLLHAVDRKIVTDRALLGYLSGLCIFLGLIGTFIGLMEMVGSVGSIIGGVASADAGSPEAIKQLIRDLEAPLKGMATGFSASLFGLFSSLILGLTARFSTQATNGLRNELEAWLGAMSRIESERETLDHVVGLPEEPMGRLGGVAVAFMTAMQRTGQLVSRASDAIRLLADRQAEQGVALARVCTDLGAVARQNADLRETLERTTSVQQSLLETRGELRSGLEGVSRRMDAAAERLGGAITGSRDDVLSLMQAVGERQSDGIRQAAASVQRVDDTLRQMQIQQAGALVEQQRSLAEVGSSVSSLRGDVGAAAGRMSGALGGVQEALAGLSGRTDALSERQQRDAGLLAAALQGLDQRLVEHGQQRAASDQAVETGLARIVGAVGETSGTIQLRLDQQADESRRVVSQVACLQDVVASLSATFDGSLSRQSAESAARAEADGAVLDKLVRHQAEIGRGLAMVVDVVALQRNGIDADLRESIGAGFGQLSEALVDSQAELARVLGDSLKASAASNGVSDVAQALTSELRDLRRSLEHGLSIGFEDVRQSMSQVIDGMVRHPDDGPALVAERLEDDTDLPLVSPSSGESLDIDALRRLAMNATRGR